MLYPSAGRGQFPPAEIPGRDVEVAGGSAHTLGIRKPSDDRLRLLQSWSSLACWRYAGSVRFGPKGVGCRRESSGSLRGGVGEDVTHPCQGFLPLDNRLESCATT